MLSQQAQELQIWRNITEIKLNVRVDATFRDMCVDDVGGGCSATETRYDVNLLERVLLDWPDVYQWRIQDFPGEGARTAKVGAPTYFEEFGPGGSSLASLGSANVHWCLEMLDRWLQGGGCYSTGGWDG